MAQQVKEAIALQRFKQLLNEKKSRSAVSASDEVSIWGVRLQPDAVDDRTDVILLKFLQARSFKVEKAFDMLSRTILWRKQFGIEELLHEDEDGVEDLDCCIERAFFVSGRDREGHPVCYNVYGALRDRELYDKAFSDEAKRERFLKRRILSVEKTVRKLDFRAGGVSTMVHVGDLKNCPGPENTAPLVALISTSQLLIENYPEFVERQICINVPWWWLALNRIISPFLTKRMKSKFVVAGPSKSSDTLLRYVGVDRIPTRCEGRLTKRDGEFETWDTATWVTLKPAAKHTVEFPVTEKCKLRWEIEAIEREVSYRVEFKEGSSNTSTVWRLILNFENSSATKHKKILYRIKSQQPSSS